MKNIKENRRKVLLSVAGIALVVALGVGLSVRPRENDQRWLLENSDRFILYSLIPYPEDDEFKTVGKFRNWDVLGQTRITDPKLKARLVGALYGAMNSQVDERASCFFPRHGIRATRDGRTLDVVICFECSGVELHENGNAHVQFVTREPQKLFDQALIRSKISLGGRQP